MNQVDKSKQCVWPAPKRPKLGMGQIEQTEIAQEPVKTEQNMGKSHNRQDKICELARQRDQNWVCARPKIGYDRD